MTQAERAAFVKEELAQMRALEERRGGGALQMRQEWRRRTGLSVEIDDIIGIRRAMKMGLRVEQSRNVDERHSIVVLGGRNPDGTPYRYATLLFKDGDAWRERVLSPSACPDRRACSKFAPDDLPPVINLTASALGVGAYIGAAPLVLHVFRNRPDGEAIDHDYEHTWGLWYQMMRADGRAPVSPATLR
jgi:hypothetical protein